MAYRNQPRQAGMRRHTDGQGNVTDIPYASSTNGSGSVPASPGNYGGGPQDPFEGQQQAPTPAPPQAIDVQPLPAADVADPSLARYNAFLSHRQALSGGDPLYDPNLMGGNRVSRSMPQASGLPTIILNNPDELAAAADLSHQDSKWAGLQVRAARNVLDPSHPGGPRPDIAAQFLQGVDLLNNKRGTSYESRLQYYMNKLRGGVTPLPTNGYQPSEDEG